MGIRCFGSFTAATPPVITVQSPSFLSVTRSAKGIWVVTTTPGMGDDALESVVLTQVAQACAANGMRMSSGRHTTDTTKTINALEEGAVGGASAAQDLAMSFAIIDASDINEGCVAAAGSLTWTGAAWAWLWQDGGFSSAAPVINGAGDVTVSLRADNGQDATESICLLTPRFTHAASDIITCGYVNVNDTDRRITITQEQAGGAASALTSIAFDIVVIGLARAKDSPASETVLAAAVDCTTGAPATVWGSSKFRRIISAGAGLPEIDFMANGGLAYNRSAMILKPQVQLAASGLWGISSEPGVAASLVARQVTCVQEQGGGAASILADPTNLAVAMFANRG